MWVCLVARKLAWKGFLPKFPLFGCKEILEIKKGVGHLGLVSSGFESIIYSLVISKTSVFSITPPAVHLLPHCHYSSPLLSSPLIKEAIEPAITAFQAAFCG